MRRARAHLLLLTAVTTGALVAGPFAVPGQAADPTVITDVATPAPGRLTATVTTSASHVYVRVGRYGTGYVGDSVLAAEAGSVALDLATWGLSDTATLEVYGCTDDTVSSCSFGTPLAIAAVSPQEATPTITWPDATHLGPDSAPYDVSVSDPDGGGRLDAIWSGAKDLGPERARLDRAGTTTLALPDGSLTLGVLRCSADGVVCHSIAGLDRQVVVLRDNDGTITVTPSLLGGSAPTIDLALKGPADQSVDLDLQIVDRSTGAALDPQRTLSFTGVATNDAGIGHVSADLSGLPTGDYALTGTLSFDEPVLGRQSGAVTTPDGFDVDADGPRVITHRLSSTALYPAADGYLDSVTLTTTVRESQRFVARYEVLDGSGRVVHRATTTPQTSRTSFGWSGRTSTGTAAAGRYTIRTTLTDDLGNVTVTPSVSVSVSAKRLRAHTFVTTVSAKGSMYDSYVGRCSTLRSPSRRGWFGSLGYETATKCRTSTSQTLISTAHAVRVPKAFSYGRLSVSVYGGASKGFAGSRAYLAYDHRDDGWSNDRLLSSTVGPHAGSSVPATNYVYPDRSIAWLLYTAAGAHYDVKSFTVRLPYRVLE